MVRAMLRRSGLSTFATSSEANLQPDLPARSFFAQNAPNQEYRGGAGRSFRSSSIPPGGPTRARCWREGLMDGTTDVGRIVARAKNEALFREINERLQDLNGD